MSLKCPRCGREFDVTLFEFGREVSCPCGERISLAGGHIIHGEHRRVNGGQEAENGPAGAENGPAGGADRDESTPGRESDGKPKKGEAGGEDGRDESGKGIDWESLEKEIFESVREKEKRLDRLRAAKFRREADRIVSLILYSDMPRVDIEIRIRSFRERVLDVFPGKEKLFDTLYLNRFRRIWTQFRDEEEPLEGI